MSDLIKAGDTVEFGNCEALVLGLYPGHAVTSDGRKAMIRTKHGDCFVAYSLLRRLSCHWCGVRPLFRVFGEVMVCVDCAPKLRGAVSVPDGAAGALTVAA